MPAILGRENLLAAAKPKVIRHEIDPNESFPEGSVAFVRDLPTGKGIEFQKRADAAGKDPTVYIGVLMDWLIDALVDEEGNRLFTVEDRKRFEDMNLEPFFPIFHSAIKRANDLKTTEKNSEASPT